MLQRIWNDRPLPVRVALGYFGFGLAWILGSDTAVQVLATSKTQHAWLQTYKGTGFIALSALLIAWLVHAETRRRSTLRRLLDEIVELAPDPVLVRTYDDGRIVETNERFLREIGCEAEDLTSVSLDDLDLDLAERQRPDLRRQLADTGEVLNYRQTLDTRDGRPVELLVSSRRINLGDGDYVATVAKDITELEKAYDETIQGWARALELRDDETFGHTLRVTHATLALAKKVGVPEEQLVHIRRGALLHDVGKIGIPDEILLKDGPLTDEERAVVEKHPIFARQLLEPIDYLRPAIAIPYHHHEKWDGTGYPEGLAGENIPLAARIFAVVDVWDALRSDRPYRDGWEPERVLEHLEEDKGSHFQPDLVDAFLDLGRERHRELRATDCVSILREVG